MRLSADERRREYNEERRNEYENYVEEERDGKTWMQLLSAQCTFLLTLIPRLESVIEMLEAEMNSIFCEIIDITLR